VTTNPPRMLRPGLVSAEAIEALVGPLGRPATATACKTLPSPGMLPRHYAPRTPVVCIQGDARPMVDALALEGKRIGWLTFAPVSDTVPTGVILRPLSAEPANAAAQLYAALHELDAASLDQIVVALPPDTEAWLAIRDRLRRASS
jgi:L-threonylcarbamoyladenylate synthase